MLYLVGLLLQVGHFFGKKDLHKAAFHMSSPPCTNAQVSYYFPAQLASHCITLHHTATHCNTLQHTATLCNTLQHTDRLLTPGPVPYQFPAQPLRLMPLPILMLLQHTSSPPPILLHLLFLHFLHGAGHSATHVILGATRPNCANSDTEELDI